METLNTEETYNQPLDHSRLYRMVQSYLDASRENANLCRRDRRYYDGDQLSTATRAELAKRGQPPIFTNKIFPSISGLLGILDAGESDPEAFPRTQSGQDAADVATKTLRFVANKTDYKNVRKQASENYLIQGTCAAIVEWTGRSINVSRIRWEDFIHDPLSREYDFADAKFLGLAKLLDATDVEAMYPEAYDKLGKPVGDMQNFFDEDSKSRWWSSSDRKQVRVVDLYYEHGGDWHRAIFVDSGMLHAGLSEYQDDDGLSICPVMAASYEVKQNGDRYGPIRNMVPLQDEINARRSRLLHLTNHRQVRQTDLYAPAANAAIAKREASKADGAIPFGWEAISAPDLAQGQMLILQQSSIELDRLSPTPAVLGRVSSTAESGRSRQILQQAGYTETARAFGRFEAFELSIFRQMWLTARQYLDQPTWVRIVDDARAADFMMVNEPIMGPVQIPAMNPSTGEPMVDEWGQPQMTVTMGQIGTKNRLAELDMDIILATVPDVVTLEQEIFQTLMETQQSTGISVFDPQFLAIIEMSPLPNKRATIEKIQRLASEAQQQNSEAQQAAQQQALAASAADIEATQAKAQRDAAMAQKALTEAQFTGFPGLDQRIA